MDFNEFKRVKNISVASDRNAFFKLE